MPGKANTVVRRQRAGSRSGCTWHWVVVAALTTVGSAHAPALADAADVRVSGRVAHALTRQPIAGAVVYVREWKGLSDEHGRFFIVLPVGRWTAEAAADGFRPATVPVEACAGCEREIEILLVPKPLVEEHVEVSASVSDGRDLVPTTPVRATEVLNTAGAFENVFRVLQTLPGVASTGEWSSRLSVRGGGPDQNMTVMDGVEVHNPYRLYGLVSAFNPEIVSGFELSTGAFSARYGDRLSSILTIDNRVGQTATRVGGSLGLSLTDGNAIAEGRLPGGAGSWLVTGRRTWYDLVAERFADDEDELPGFADLQGKFAFDLGAGRSFTLSGLRSRERSEVEFAEDFDAGVVDSRTRNDLAAATLFLPLGTVGWSRTIGALYENTDDFTLNGRFRAEARRSNSPGDDVAFSYDAIAGSLARHVRDRSLRQELSLRPLPGHLLGAGFELHDLATRERLHIDLGARPEEDLRRVSFSYDARRSHRRYGAFLSDRIRLGGRVELEAGLRYDESGINAIRELTPRVAVSARLRPGTTLRAAFGVHTQSPGYEKLFQADYALDFSEEGRLRLENERARHYVVGLERDLGSGLTARVEGFYKEFEDLIVGRLETEDERRGRLALYDFPAGLAGSVPRERQITAEPVNGASGRAWGLDVFLARRATSSATRLSGWLAYTYTSANREAYGRTYPFEYEQPHALSVVASFRAHQRVELALTGRLSSGFPRTAPLGLRAAGVRDAADGDRDGITDEIVPERDGEGSLVYGIDYGGIDNVNRSRGPTYARVDFRATFVPSWGKGRWRVYVDLINVLGRNNGLVLEELAHDPASSAPRLVTQRDDGFPFVPSFGVHVRF